MRPVDATLRALFALVALSLAAHGGAAEAGAASFPRLMGMNIGAKNYQDPDYQRDLSRLDVVILGFHKGWQPSGYAADASSAVRKAVQAIKARNPKVLVGQYTVLNEAYDDPRDPASVDLRDKLYASQWWLPDAAGRKVQWTSQFSTWEVNFTDWAKPDAGGRRWPQWLAERNHAAFFRDVPEFDIVYIDNLMNPPRVRADWDADRANDDPRSAKGHTRQPRIVGFGVHGSPSDFRLFRSGNAATTVALEPGLRRLVGRQDPAINDGGAVSSLRLPAKGGIVLRK